MNDCLQDIAFLILNYNDYEETIACVRELLSIDTEAKIVIVDNGSENNSYHELCKFSRANENIVVLANKKNGGYAKGNNVGFRFICQHMIEIDYIVLMNPDTRPKSKTTIIRLRDILINNKTAGIAAPIVIYNGEINYGMSAWNCPNCTGIIIRQSRFLHEKQTVYADKNTKGTVTVDAVQGGFFMIKKETIKKIDFLDEGTFLYGEEIILGKDIKKAGYCELLTCDEYFIHNHKRIQEARDLRWKIRDEIIHYKSRKRYCIKHLNLASTMGVSVMMIMNLICIIINHLYVKTRRTKRIE